ncbi:MAG: methionyl-tRNA formyltransferase [Elusimicrobia bacterium]|nr:methionyl-tRNA formyltransferase [Elusimicrobiota bacterium]
MLTTVFFGTPLVAVPFLERLAKTSTVLGVVTSPDRPAGRGYGLAPTEVKRAAQSLGIPVQQPERLAGFSIEGAFGKKPDVGIVVAYGHLIPPSVFNEPRQGLVNIHFSLVPQYRGAGPMQWVLIRGETETGVSLFRIEKGLDTGPVFLQGRQTIDPADDAVTLREKLVALGLELMDNFLRQLEEGPWAPTPQSGAVSTAPLLTKEDGRIRWSLRSAGEIVNLIRGTCEWPGAYGVLKGQRMKIRRAESCPGGAGAPGEIIAVEKDRGFLVKCASDSLLVRSLQPEGKKEMDAPRFWNGARLSVGDRFEE